MNPNVIEMSDWNIEIKYYFHMNALVESGLANKIIETQIPSPNQHCNVWYLGHSFVGKLCTWLWI